MTCVEKSVIKSDYFVGFFPWFGTRRFREKHLPFAVINDRITDKSQRNS